MAVMTRWDPRRELFRIQDELSRAFGQSFGPDALDVGTRAWVPALDVFEREDALVVVVELPGVNADNIEVLMEDSTLTIRGERHFYGDIPEDSFRRVERRFGTFQRTLTLPGQFESNRISASYRDGVLTVTVPKAEAARPKRIAVKTEG